VTATTSVVPSPAERALARVVASAVARPANAYLLTGGDDATGLASRALACALIHAAEADQDRVERGVHPDVVELQPSGASGYLAEQVDGEIRTQANRAPLEAPRKVLVVNRADVLGPLLESALLKTIEEPPPLTSFILCCSDPAGVADTIVSRCVAVAVPPLAVEAAGHRIAAETGVDPAEAARLVAATGSVDRARAVITDPATAQRRSRWLAVPARLGSTGASELARELMADFDDAMAELGERQAAEREDLAAHLGGGNVRGAKGAQKALEDRHNREQRAQRTALLRLLVATLAGWCRDVMAACAGAPVLNTEVEGDVAAAAASVGAGGALAALGRLGRLEDALEYNANADLLVESILVDLRVILGR